MRRACTHALMAALLVTSSSSAATGRIEGTITPVGCVRKVLAIDRNVKLPFVARKVKVNETEGKLIEGGKRFRIQVPPGEYDLHFELKDGRLLEGADMRVDVPEDARQLTTRDLKGIRDRAAKIRTFEDKKEVLEIAGRGEYARAIVKLLRTKPTSYDRKFGKPLAIFRWELWEFRKRTGSWVRDRSVRVLRRFMVAKTEMGDMKWEFRGSLGGLSVSAGGLVTRNVDLTAAGSVPGAAKPENNDT